MQPLNQLLDSRFLTLDMRIHGPSGQLRTQPVTLNSAA